MKPLHKIIPTTLTFCCLAANHAQAQTSEPAPRAEVTAEAPAEAPAQAPVQLDAVVVSGSAVPDYIAKTSSAGSRQDLPIEDIPQAVSVIGDALIDDLGNVSLSNIADYVAGVDPSTGAASPFGSNYVIRGFDTGAAASTINGFREFGFQTPRTRVNVERVEFLKGPASVLYGGGFALSGLVNIVTKQPTANALGSVEVSLGSFSEREVELDFGGPITQDKTLRYRLTAAYTEGGNFTDFYDQDSRFVSPYLRWDITPNTTLDVELVAQRVHYDGELETSLYAAPVSFQVPVELNQSDPAFSRGEDELGSAHIELRHRFGQGWMLRQGLLFQYVNTDASSIQPQGLRDDGHTVDRGYREVFGFQRDRSSQTELSGDQTFWGLRHQAIIGLELANYRFGYTFLRAPFTELDLLNPQYSGSLQGPIALDGLPEEYGVRSTAFYAQDLVTLSSQWKLMAGVRHDRTHSDYRPMDKTEPPRDSRRLLHLRRWSHDESIEVFPGGTGACGPDGVGARSGVRIAVGGDRIDRGQDRVYG